MGGETLIEFSWSTARGWLVAAIPIDVAPILVVPTPTPVARPAVSIEATEVFDELHVTVKPKFEVLPFV
jgi:hypothetical protein